MQMRKRATRSILLEVFHRCIKCFVVGQHTAEAQEGFQPCYL